MPKGIITVKNYKHLSSLLKRDLDSVVRLCRFLKRRLFTLSYSRKICVFAKVLTHDSGKKIPNIFQACFSVKQTLVFLFDDVLVFKEGFLD